MRILALDTATEACSVALLLGAEVRGLAKEVGRGHAEEILVMIDAILAEAGISLSGVECIAASVGPGSFTGVRISVAVAQGLAFGAGLPVVPVSTLEALSLRAKRAGAGHILACLDARMGEVYWGCFAADATLGLLACGMPAVGPAASVTVPFTGPFSGIGRGFSAYAQLDSLPGLRIEPQDRVMLPDASEMARLGEIRLRAGLAIDPAALEPLYLRNKVALTVAERAASMVLR